MNAPRRGAFSEQNKTPGRECVRALHREEVGDYRGGRAIAVRPPPLLDPLELAPAVDPELEPPDDPEDPDDDDG